MCQIQMGKMVGIANPRQRTLAKGRVRLSAEVSPMADIQHRDIYSMNMSLQILLLTN
jgi:hypothetical protein